MNNAVLLAFCSTADRERVDYDDILVRRGDPLLLIAIGPDGGAALARWVEAHGLDGVAGIGLVGVTTPWAERGVYIDPGSGVRYGASCIALGPLEPLRAAAEGARRGRQCDICGGAGDVRYSAGGRVDCGECDGTGTSHVRRVAIACAPDDGRCRVCGGRGWSYGHETDATPKAYSRDECPACSGTGKALSSADVALELSGGRALYDGIDDFQATTGGLTVIHYRTRGDLDKQGIRAVIENLTQ